MMPLSEESVARPLDEPASRWRRFRDGLGLQRNIVVMLAVILVVGMGEELWVRFLPEYLVFLGGSAWIVAAYPLKKASGNHPLALDEANRRLFTGCRKEPMVLVMDTETGKEIASVPVPHDIDDLFFDAKRKRLYAACGEGFLAVIRQVDADRYEPLEKLSTGKLARTCLFDPESNRLFLGVPRFGDMEGPEIWVYRVRD
jgi:hypothetical protein